VLVVIYAPERDIHFIKKGQIARIVDNVRENAPELDGKIAYVSELADIRTRATRVEISVDNRKRLLKSGQIVQVQLTRRMLRNVIMVPLGAIIPLEQGYAAYVADQGKARRRTVTIGFLKGRRVRILSGLKAGEQLIVAGHTFVGPGQDITVVEKKSEPPGGSAQLGR